jgi:hypothetical protein
MSLEGVLAEEAVAVEVGDGVGEAGEFFRGEGGDFFFGHHATVPSAVEVVGDVEQIDSEFGAVIVTEFAGFDFEQEVLQGLGGFVEFVVDVGGVQRAREAVCEFTEDAVAEEIGSGVAEAIEFFIVEGQDFYVGQIAAVPGAVEVVGDVFERDGEFGAVIGAKLPGHNLVDELSQVEVGLAKVELEVFEVHGITNFGAVSFGGTTSLR